MRMIIIQFFSVVGFLATMLWLWSLTPPLRAWLMQESAVVFSIPKRPRPTPAYSADGDQPTLQLAVPQACVPAAAVPDPLPEWKETTLSQLIVHAVQAHHARLLEDALEERTPFPLIDVREAFG